MRSFFFTSTMGAHYALEGANPVCRGEAVTAPLPSNQGSLSGARIVLDPVHGLPRQPGLFRYPRDAHGLLGQQGSCVVA
jgi:hypothetical protein